MKKLIALLLALAMVFGMVACGAKAPEAYDNRFFAQIYIFERRLWTILTT